MAAVCESITDVADLRYTGYFSIYYEIVSGENSGVRAELQLRTILSRRHGAGLIVNIDTRALATIILPKKFFQ